MLTRSIKICLLIFSLGIVISCDEDEPSVSSEPSFSIEGVVTGLPGESFTMNGLVSDAAGIQEVSIEYAAWNLSKVIEVDASITQYQLAFSFQVPETETVGSSHSLTVSATNAGGNVSTTQVEIVLSGDNTPPVINVTTPNDGGTYISSSGPEFSLSFEVTDDNEIATVSLVGVGFNEENEVNGASYSFTEEVDFSIAGTYTISITATDNSGNVATSTTAVTIEESLRFEKMYLADVATDEELVSDAFGVPMLINGFTQEDSAGVIFEALYYNKTANTEIRFVPQKSSFAPFTFGAGENAGELGLGSDASISPIVLPEVGYYSIVLNLASLTYTMDTYTPTDAAFDMIMLMGTGVRVDGESTCVSNTDGSEACWNFASGKELTVDANNPYLFTAPVELFDHDPDGDGNNGFILGANPSGWSPFWRFDVGDELDLEPEFTVPDGGGNYIFSEAKYGMYTFEFDTHLNRAKVVAQ